MVVKNPTINLVDYRRYSKKQEIKNGELPKVFYVEKIVNDINYEAGSCLKAITVQDLINLGWTVNIRAPRESDF